MSIPLPTTIVPPLAATEPPLQAAASTSALVPNPSLPMGAPAAPRAVFTPEQTTEAIVDLSHGMAEMRLTLQSILHFLNPTPQQYGVPPHQPALPPPQYTAPQHTAPISYP
jgi:hypothetical protein